jgi:hypothetical protein
MPMPIEAASFSRRPPTSYRLVSVGDWIMTRTPKIGYALF